MIVVCKYIMSVFVLALGAVALFYVRYGLTMKKKDNVPGFLSVFVMEPLVFVVCCQCFL